MILLALLLAVGTDVRVCDKANATLCASVAADGTLKVTTGSGGSFADNAAFTAGTTSVTNIGGVFNDSITSLTIGSAGAPRLTSKRALHFNLRDSSGNEVILPLALVNGGFNVNLNNASLAVTGTFWQATQPVSIAAAVDVSDRAARLVGVVYGSQAQQLKQTATNFNLQSELAVGGTLIDPRSIRALTVADVVGIGAGSALIGKVGIDQTTVGTTNAVSIAQVGATTILTGGIAGSQGIGGLAADGGAVVGNPVLSSGKGFNGTSLAPRFCDKVAQITTLGTTAVVQQIALVAAQKIWICGYQILGSTATAGTALSWVEGTGANCVTGQTAVTPALFTTPTVAPTVANFTLGPWGGGALSWTQVAGDALCLKQASATNSTLLSGFIWYTQN